MKGIARTASDRVENYLIKCPGTVCTRSGAKLTVKPQILATPPESHSRQTSIHPENLRVPPIFPFCFRGFNPSHHLLLALCQPLYGILLCQLLLQAEPPSVCTEVLLLGLVQKFGVQDSASRV